MKRNHQGGIWGGTSPRVEWLKLKHHEHGLQLWDRSRIALLCQLLGCTVYELAAAAGEYDPRKVEAYYKWDKWPMSLLLHFDRYEKSAHKMTLNSSAMSHGDISFACAFAATIKEPEPTPHSTE